MPLYKVLGARQTLYSMNVNAESKLGAYDIAQEKDSTAWNELETDNIIEIVEVEEDNG